MFSVSWVLRVAHHLLSHLRACGHLLHQSGVKKVVNVTKCEQPQNDNSGAPLDCQWHSPFSPPFLYSRGSSKYETAASK